MSTFAETPAPPYYAVIFTTTHTDDSEGYGEAAQRMEALAAEQPGFLGIEHAGNGIGITVSYWASEDAIAGWKRNAEHLEAQRTGRQRWYAGFRLRVAKVERDYGFDR